MLKNVNANENVDIDDNNKYSDMRGIVIITIMTIYI